MKKIICFLTLLATLAGTAIAADCGEGIKTCECGDTLINSYNLSAADPVTYTGCRGNGLIIGSNDISLDCQGESIRGNFGESGIILSHVDNCIVTNCDIHDFQIGIFSENSMNNKLTKNTLNNNIFGIVLSGESNTLTGNTANDNTESGISVFVSNNNQLTNNTANNNDRGIELIGSGLNVLSGNTANGNVMGISLVESFNNTLTGNTANNNNARGLYLTDSPGNGVEGNTFCSNSIDLGSFDIVNSSSDSYGIDNMCDETSGWNDNGATGCTYACLSFICGNGILEEGEECDGTAHCSSCTCEDPYVPDGNGNCILEPTLPAPENTGLLALVTMTLIAPALIYLRRKG